MVEISISNLQGKDAELVAMARDAVLLSYSPYSHFAVGAAVLLANGKIVQGANQENASYPVGICAERSTLATAQNLYPNVPIVALALAAEGADGMFTSEYITPCGMCRQAIAEVEKRYDKSVRILMTSRDNVAVVDTVNALLPLSFN